MGRSADQIKDFIITKVGEKSSLSVISSNVDDNALWKQFVECVSDVIADHSEYADAHISRVEEIVTSGNPHSAPWIAQKALQFQYDQDTPQVLTTIDGIVQFETIDESKRIITNCTVRTTSSRTATVIVSKGDPLEKLSDLELSAFNGYLNSILNTSFNLAGVRNACVSNEPDYCYIKAEVKYNGLYSTTIEANVTAAIEFYLANLGILGTVSAYKLSEAVQAVPGVKDFIIEDMSIRPNATLFASATYLITSFLDNQTVSLETAAGHAYTEVEPTYELTNKLTFTVV